jgi:hypothetical protein
MSIWAKRDFLDTANLDCYELMLQQAWQGFQGLLMVATPDESNDYTRATIYIRLPEPHLLADYNGFEEIGELSLPKEAVLIYGDQEEFTTRFKYRRA